ncbi:hypothetical protein [Acaryochloris sp. 'Moss Beach']|nr:hypothetical protein [Acaryochloris sp. 'Moss Beach']
MNDPALSRTGFSSHSLQQQNPGNNPQDPTDGACEKQEWREGDQN